MSADSTCTCTKKDIELSFQKLESFIIGKGGGRKGCDENDNDLVDAELGDPILFDAEKVKYKFSILYIRI